METTLNDVLEKQELKNKVKTAAQKFLYRKGYDFIDSDDLPYEVMKLFDFVAIDREHDNAIVFVKVFTNINQRKFDDGELSMKKCEEAMIAFVEKNKDYVNNPVRVDKISIAAVDIDRALLRHHINALSLQS